MLTRQAILRRADDDRGDAPVAERDYVLAHVVSRLHRSSLGEGERLVFKGGTAVRFVHVEDFRYSADLDFTIEAIGTFYQDTLDNRLPPGEGDFDVPRFIQAIDSLG